MRGTSRRKATLHPRRKGIGAAVGWRSLMGVNAPSADTEEAVPARNGRMRRSWERSVALNAILAGILTALTIFVLATWPADDADGEADRTEPHATEPARGTGGEGSGSGTGTGTGTGDGSLREGHGADSRADAAGGGTDVPSPAADGAGDADAAAAPSVAPATSVVAASGPGEASPLPIGFTVPDASEPTAAEPSTAQPTGPAADGRAGGGVPRFMGVALTGRRIVFLVDRSRSMEGPRFETTRGELRRAISALSGDVSFSVIMFGSLPLDGSRGSVILPPGLPRRATATAKREALEWLSRATTETAGGSHAMPAVQEALRMKPDTIVLLTDGELDEPGKVEAAFRASNLRGRIAVHTILLQNTEGAIVMQRIASESGGTYQLLERLPNP